MTGRPFPDWSLLDRVVTVMAELSGVEVKVLVAIAIHADGDGFAYPSRVTIAEICGIDPSMVTRSTNKLRSLGYLVLAEPGSSSRRRSNCYRVLPSVGAPESPVTGDDESPSGVTLGVTLGVTNSHTKTQKTQKRESLVSEVDAVHDLHSGGAPQTKRKREPRNREKREPDYLFEALAEACGLDWQDGLTRSARGSLNRAVRDLREIGVEPEEIRQRARRYRVLWPNVSLTPAALAKQWPLLNGKASGENPDSVFQQALAKHQREHPEIR